MRQRRHTIVAWGTFMQAMPGGRTDRERPVGEDIDHAVELADEPSDEGGSIAAVVIHLCLAHRDRVLGDVDLRVWQ